MSRFLTTIVQLALLVSTFYLLRLAIQDIKENGFQFSNPEQDLKLLPNFGRPVRACRPQSYPQAKNVRFITKKMSEMSVFGFDFVSEK